VCARVVAYLCIALSLSLSLSLTLSLARPDGHEGGGPQTPAHCVQGLVTCLSDADVPVVAHAAVALGFWIGRDGGMQAVDPSPSLFFRSTRNACAKCAYVCSTCDQRRVQACVPPYLDHSWSIESLSHSLTAWPLSHTHALTLCLFSLSLSVSVSMSLLRLWASAVNDGLRPSVPAILHCKHRHAD
jgi:hypothetical protein